jgi:hypothetical protein
MSETNEKDLSMDDETWENRISRITQWMKEHRALIKEDEDVSDSVDILKMNIKRGGKRAHMRKKYWSSILLEGRNLHEWPIQKGKESTLPQNVQDSLKEIGISIHDVYVAFWNDNSIVQTIAVVSDRNKSQGGQSHPDAETYAKGRVLAVRQRMTKYFNDGRWDGNYNAEEGIEIGLPPNDEEESTTETGEANV